MAESMFPRSVVEDFAREGFARGWSEGVQAARDAVNNSATVLDALAAIDALRGDA